MCMVGNAAVSGGVRRTALLSLFDYDDLDRWTITKLDGRTGIPEGESSP